MIHQKEMNEISSDKSESSLQDDKPGEECGVFGCYYLASADNSEAARSTFFGLYALQHRGQESCGIATTDGRSVFVHKGMGLVSQVFTETNIKTLTGHCAVGHNRYSTEGGSELRNAQPFVLDTMLGPLGLAHNGTITRHKRLRQLVLQRGVGLFTSSDSELIAQLLAGVPSTTDQPATWENSITQFMNLCEGAYSLVLLTRNALFGVRDRYGLRPLCIGEIKKDETGERLGYCLASESCALSTIGASYLREVRPGEIVRIDHEGYVNGNIPDSSDLVFSRLRTIMGCPPAPTPALCVFEYVYFSRPDTLLEDQLVHQVRQELGKRLAMEAPCPGADAVVPVPDSSFPAAIAYSLATGIPFMEGLTKNRYIGRTFIQPDNRLRQRGVKIKFNPLPQNLAGKTVVLIDDSIVRGNTLGPIIKLLREVGAKAVHVRISSPPVKHPCFMGIDMSTYKELIAHEKTVEQIRVHANADSLHFISVEGMMSAVQSGVAAGRSKGNCNACFTGTYPLDIEEIVQMSPASRDARAKDTC